MNRFFDACNNMSDEALILLKSGIKLAFGVLIIGVCAYKYNDSFIGEYRNVELCIGIVQAAFSLFVQFIVGSIILDCVQKGK